MLNGMRMTASRVQGHRYLQRSVPSRCTTRRRRIHSDAARGAAPAAGRAASAAPFTRIEGFDCVVGLTGGIASGKSTARHVLQSRGATVVDADSMGHRVYEPGSKGIELVVDAFGSAVLSPDGAIDRRALGDAVFGKAEELKRLTDIVWPLIAEMLASELAAQSPRARQRAAAAQQPSVAVIEAAVLLESGWDAMVDEVWSMTCDPDEAARRVVGRDGLTEAQARARLSAQLSNEQRAARSAVVVDSSGPAEATAEQLNLEWDRLLLRLQR